MDATNDQMLPNEEHDLEKRGGGTNYPSSDDQA